MLGPLKTAQSTDSKIIHHDQKLAPGWIEPTKIDT